MQKVCEYHKDGIARRPFINGHLRRHKAKGIVYKEKKKQTNHRITFDNPLPILGSELELAWKRSYDMKTREDVWKNVPFIVFSLRSLISYVRAGGANLNLFSIV